MLANNVDPDQTPQYVASDLSLTILNGFPRKNGLKQSCINHVAPCTFMFGCHLKKVYNFLFASLLEEVISKWWLLFEEPK